ncbi:glycosyltransferase family protein [Alphaproteobacteria bacterium]|nr:glycosyltransferase family protein [Alphaproteobacteria bacterium]MDB2324433.1 glycosyltransferase family protein [Alphaproteobacteria bacterium]
MDGPNIAIIIQARMNSSRLPGKILMDIGGAPLLAHLIRRVKTSKLSDHVVVATTDQSIDDLVEGVCINEGVSVFRGSEQNVLERMILASKSVNADAIVRITADNPFVNGELVDLVLRRFLETYPNIDYASNTEKSGFPFGLFVEVVKMSSLIKVNENNPSPAQMEHVTISFRSNSNSYNVCNVKTELNFGDLLLSVDTIEDYIRVCPLFDQLIKINPYFGLSDIAKLVK